MAILIIVALSISIAAVLTTVEGGLKLSRTDQNRTNAFQQANGGIDHAMYRIDHSGGRTTGASGFLPNVAAGAYTPLFTEVVSPTVGTQTYLTGFTDSVSVPGTPRVDYTIRAELDPKPSATKPYQTTRWRVVSVGTDAGSGRLREAVATISATPFFLNGFFTLQDFYLTGNQDTPVAFYSEQNPAGAVVHASNPGNPVPGFLGTNATIAGADATITAFAEKWQGFNMYGRASQTAADAACAGGLCSTELATFGRGPVNAITDSLKIETPSNRRARPCPTLANGSGGGKFIGAIPPGDYTCANVILTTSATESQVYVDPTFGAGNGSGKVRIWPTNSFNVTPGTTVNKGFAPCTSNNDATRCRRPANFQVYFDKPAHALDDSSSICGQGGSGTEIWAVLYTPSLGVDCRGEGQPKIFGSVVANIHSGTGNHFDFHWDLDSVLIENNGKFVVTDWRECPLRANTPAAAAAAAAC